MALASLKGSSGVVSVPLSMFYIAPSNSSRVTLVKTSQPERLTVNLRSATVGAVMIVEALSSTEEQDLVRVISSRQGRRDIIGKSVITLNGLSWDRI